VVNAQLSLPADIPLGDYELLLNLPDPAPSLYTNTAYSIRLANSNAVSSTITMPVWEATTGYHHLGATLTIDTTATNAAPGADEIPVRSFSSIAETYDTWKARNFALNPAGGSPEADPDGDGRANLLEYAMGTDPNFPDRNNELNLSFSNQSLFLSLTKGPGVKDVQFEFEGSPTLAPANWSTSSIAILKNDASAIDASYTGVAPSAFFRLKVTLP
jgi:hypothetical protein